MELEAGTYFAVFRRPAAHASQVAVSYRLELEPLLVELPPPGAGCEEAVSLAPELARQRVVGTTVGASDLLASECGGVGAGEVVYVLDLDAPRWLSASLTPYGFDGVLSLRGADCAAGEVLACGTALGEQRLAAGRYHLVVDGATLGSVGDFALVVRLGPLAGHGEACVPGEIGCLPGAFCVSDAPGLDPRCLALEPASVSLWGASLDGGLLLRLHPGTGEVLEPLPAPGGLRGPDCGLALAPDGSLLLGDAGNPDLGLRVVDPLSGDATGSIELPEGTHVAGLERGAGELLLLDAGRSRLSVLAPDSGLEVLSFPLAPTATLSGLAAREGVALVVQQLAQVWYLTEQPLSEGAASSSRPLPAVGAYSSAALVGSLLYLATDEGDISVLEAHSLRVVGQLRPPQGRICGLAGRSL